VRGTGYQGEGIRSLKGGKGDWPVRGGGGRGEGGTGRCNIKAGGGRNDVNVTQCKLKFVKRRRHKDALRKGRGEGIEGI